MKRLCALVMVVVTAFVPACSTVDPSDEDRIAAAIQSIDPARRAELNRLGRMYDACNHVDKWLSRSDQAQNRPSFYCYEHLGSPGVPIAATPSLFNELCHQWDGFGKLRDHLSIAYRAYAGQMHGKTYAGCYPQLGGLDEKIVEADEQYPEPASNARIIELLLTGAIPAAVLTIAVPELLPVLCALGQDVYCDDNSPGTTPTPLPIPTTPPDPDAP